MVADRKIQEALLRGLAHRIKDWGLAEPALLILESHKPLSFLASQFLIFTVPFLGSGIKDYADLLEDREALENLITKLREGGKGSE